MALKSIGADLLKEHNELYFELIKIPEDRELIFHIDNQNGNQFGKPRFKEPLYSWNTDLLNRLHNHLENIKAFFNTYSYWFDETIRPIITIDNQNINRKSLIFLLQEDIDKTDEVYADYFIEKSLSKYTISYYRRNQKRQIFEPKINSPADLEKWICLDARKQIIDQFTFLWSYLQTEIESCIKGDFTKLPDEFFTREYIIKQNNDISYILSQYPELAMLKLGRIAELYLMQILNIKNGHREANLAWLAKNEGLISHQQTILFDSIRKEYNALSHRLDYFVNKTKIERLWNNFSTIING